jgi:hypothetical protein
LTLRKDIYVDAAILAGAFVAAMAGIAALWRLA